MPASRPEAWKAWGGGSVGDGVKDGPLVGVFVAGEVVGVTDATVGSGEGAAIVAPGEVQEARAIAAVTRMDTAGGTSGRSGTGAMALGGLSRRRDMDHRI
jgi:hypothetical protein